MSLKAGARGFGTGLLLAGLLAAPADCLAQQHRQVTPRVHAVPGVAATVGGPKAGTAAGPRFPLVPAGSMVTHSSTAAAHRPVTKTAAPAAIAAKAVGNGAVPRRSAAGTGRTAASRMNGKSSAPAAATSTRAPTPAHGSGIAGPARATHSGAIIAPEKGTPADDTGKDSRTDSPAPDTSGTPSAASSKTTAPQQ